ncbi:MAG TPA: hypothetical protein EYN51_07290 [Flavobacteriales bacterium]|nr:hypothetical protein [Flavobacteriales bacterium]HIA11159.1 hypothetical protein [Flavobacteriales bacterium]
MNSTGPPTADSEEVNIRIARIYRRVDGILCVHTKEDVEVTLEDSIQSYEAVVKMAAGKKALLLEFSGKGGIIQDKARDYWVAKRKDNPVIAEAIVAKSLAHKIMVNFLIRFLDAGREIKLFTKEEDAVKWLNTFRNKLD